MPSPAADPSDPDAQRALVGLNHQRQPRPLTADDVRDEPGVKPIQFTLRELLAAERSMPDIRANGTLPLDNRVLRMTLRHGSAPHILAWINAICRDECPDIARDMLAGARRSALMRKLDAITYEAVGWRPLGMGERWAALIWLLVANRVKRKTDHHLTHAPEEDEQRHTQRLATAEADVLARQIELDAASRSGASSASVARHASNSPLPSLNAPPPCARSSSSPTSATPSAAHSGSST
jgi:hypothetical protein